MSTKNEIKTREEWLVLAGQHTAKLIASAGGEVPEIMVSVGFPKGGGVRRRKIGQCWDTSCSSAGLSHVFICPTVGQDRVLDVLIHEQIHAVVGVAAKHKSPFARLAASVGLLPPGPQTTPSESLSLKLVDIIAKIGPYPHDEFTLPIRPKGAGSRYRLYECGCRIKVRCARDDLKIFCQECGAEFVLQGVDPERDPDGGSKE